MHEHLKVSQVFNGLSLPELIRRSRHRSSSPPHLFRRVSPRCKLGDRQSPSPTPRSSGLAARLRPSSRLFVPTARSLERTHSPSTPARGPTLHASSIATSNTGRHPDFPFRRRAAICTNRHRDEQENRVDCARRACCPAFPSSSSILRSSKRYFVRWSAARRERIFQQRRS